MKKYRVLDVYGSFGIFFDEEIEAENETDAKEYVLNEILDNIGNYIDEILDNIGNYIDIEIEEIEEIEE